MDMSHSQVARETPHIRVYRFAKFVGSVLTHLVTVGVEATPGDRAG